MFPGLSTVNYQSSGHSHLIDKIPPNTEEKAVEFIQGLLCSLNSEFALNLDTSAGLSLQPEGGDSQLELDEDILIVVGGGSHAERLAAAIGSWHQNMADLSIPGLKLNKATALDLASDISGIMENNNSSRVVVVLQLFDNEMYKGMSGREILDSVKKDGRYHIIGKLVTASKEEFKALFGTAIPIIKAAKAATVLLISLLYLPGGDPSDQLHRGGLHQKACQHSTIPGESAQGSGVAPPLEKCVSGKPCCPHGHWPRRQ